MEVTQLGKFQIVGTQEEYAKLATKLVAVMVGIDRIPKNGRHAQGYNYVLESDLAEAIRNLLIENEIMIAVSHEQASMHDTPPSGRDGKVHVVTDVVMHVMFTDINTGASIACSFGGSGMDDQDKGYSKATALAVKYFLMRMFLIPSGEDADDPQPAQRTSSAPPASPRPAAQQRAVVDEEEGDADLDIPFDDGKPICPLHKEPMLKHWDTGGWTCGRKDDKGDYCLGAASEDGRTYVKKPKGR